MRAMMELASRQPGYRWADMGPSLVDPSVYLVVSEWDDVEQVRAWEHEEEHSGVMEKWEPLYREPLFHQRFVPWRTRAAADSRRGVPSIDVLLRSEPGRKATLKFGRPLVKHALQATLSQIRNEAARGGAIPDRDEILAHA